MNGQTLKRCARSWEVEAVRDGRLRGHDAESLRRHLEACAVCTTERTNLERFRDDLLQLPPPHVDAIACRRIRQRLLMDHNQWLLREDGVRSPARRWPLFVFAAGVALVVGVVAFLRLKPDSHGARLAAQEPSVEVLAAVNARWRRDAAPDGLRVVLEDGELKLRIHRQRSTDRVTIVVPDGSIEDIGTVLDVVVADGRTRAVDVERGRVILRLQGDAPRTLGAGEKWQRELAPSVPESAASARATPPASPLAQARPGVSPTKQRQHAGAGRHAAVSAAAQADVGPETRPSAAEALAAKAEDDAYLQIVDLLRAQRVNQARDAAKEYLLRFPNGFRRLEVLNIATRSAP